MSIYVATPMYGGQCNAIYMESMLHLQSYLDAKNVDAYFDFLYNESLITRGRNTLVDQFLETKDATHLMFIDADIGFYPEDLMAMYEADKDIICGIYPKKEINWKGVEYAVKKDIPVDKLQNFTGVYVVDMADTKATSVPLDKPFKINYGGTGFMMIKRSVLEQLKDKVPTYTHGLTDTRTGKTTVKKIYEFFATSIDPKTNYLLSEDYHFCKLAQDNGFEIHGAGWCQLSHVGFHVYNGKLLG